MRNSKQKESREEKAIDASWAEQDIAIIIHCTILIRSKGEKQGIKKTTEAYLHKNCALSFTLGKNAAMTFEFLQKDPAKVSPDPRAYTLCNDLGALCRQGDLNIFPRMSYRPV